MPMWPFDFVFEGFGEIAERVEVLHFHLGAEFGGAAAADADVGIAAERTFFHIDVADAGVEQNLAESGEVGVSFIGRAHVRLGDDFTERGAQRLKSSRFSRRNVESRREGICRHLLRDGGA